MPVNNLTFLLINKWDWKADFGFGGAIKTGHVYPAEDQETRYMVELNKTGGVFVEKDMMEGEYMGWDCDVEEVTLENILDMPNFKENLKIMANYDFERFKVNKKAGIKETDYTQEDLDRESVASEALGNLASSLIAYEQIDRDGWDTLIEIFTMVADNLCEKGNYISLTDDLTSAPNIARVGAVTKAVRELESYLNEQDGKNLGGLYTAILTLIKEIIRQHTRIKNL